MLEGESLDINRRVEVIFNSEQETPFGVKRAEGRWQLVVNKNLFEARGFTPDEINGAVYLEEERLVKQTSVVTSSYVEGLRRWQDLATSDPKASAFKAGFERLAVLASLEEKDSDRARSARRYLEKFAGRSPSADYTDQLFSYILIKQLGHEVAPDKKPVETVLTNLQKLETIEGRSVSPLEALCSPDLSFAAKTSWFDARFLPRLRFLENQDQQKVETEMVQSTEETPKEAQTEPPQPPTPPAAEDEYEQHRGREEKGKGAPLFIISPAYTGYWEEESYDVIDESSGRLKKSDTLRIKTAVSSTPAGFLENTRRTISGYSGTALFALPLAPGFTLTEKGLGTLRNQGLETYAGGEGHIFLKSPNNNKIEVEVASRLGLVNVVHTRDEVTLDIILPDEVSDELTRINALPTDSLGKIQAWQDFIMNNFKYPSDDLVEEMYTSIDTSQSRLNAMTNGKLLDCYLAREFFIGGIKRLSLPDVIWRGVNGHFIASAQKDGTAHLSSGTKHAWVKVKVEGENNWIIFDPTPSGDPIKQGEGVINEAGELSPQPLSEEDLQALEEEAKEAEKNRSPQTSDQYLMQFSREAGIEPEEAKLILAEAAQAEELTDSQGRNILKRLMEQFERIIQEYTKIRQENLGSVEMSRGRDLDEPVDAYIDVRAGSLDPSGFAKRGFIEEKQQYYGGWDLEVVTDGSGSMEKPLGGRVKYKVQRDMSYLLHKGLHRFSKEAQRRQVRLITPLKVRSSQYMFRGNNIEEVKLLSDEFTPLQQAALWKKSAENIGGGTPAHLGLQAILDRIPPNEVQLLKDKQLLKVVALISDGGYDDPDRVQDLINRLNELNVIVAEFQITDSKSLEDLPENVATRVIEATGLLMPERVKRG